jgi:transposase
MRHYECMKAYSEDLRRKLEEAVGRGMKGSEAAYLFGVSFSSVKRYARMVPPVVN